MSMQRGSVHARPWTGLLFALAVVPMAVLLPVNPAPAITQQPCPTDLTSNVPYVIGCLGITPDPGAITRANPNALPEVRGIPCDGTNTGECIGLGLLPYPDPVVPAPDSVLRHSP